MTVVRQEFSNFDSLVVVSELELAINQALYVFLYRECKKPLLVLIKVVIITNLEQKQKSA